MINKNKLKFDIAVIGGGPSGMMAAVRAAEVGASVVLIEKNENLGKKLLITGGGRCNLTNLNIANRELVNLYGEGGKFLYSAFNNFNVQDVIGFFDSRGVKIKEEDDGRIFPVSDRALDIRLVLTELLKKNKVEVLKSVQVNGFDIKDKKIEKIKTTKGYVVADKIVLCVGGKSYPATGSVGDGFIWAKNAGHKINELKPSLTPIVIKELWVKKLQGLSLEDIEISIYEKGKKKISSQGEIIFTHEGISGPLVYNLSRTLRGLDLKRIKLRIDFIPKNNFKELDNILIDKLIKEGKKSCRNIMGDIISDKLVLVILDLLKIDKNKKGYEINKEERRGLVKNSKDLEFEVSGLSGFDKAVVTAGGVSLKEIDPRTLKSKIINNLFFAGEILDIDGPSGGYNLQVAWSTGYLAGQSAAKID
jgi:predicted Rossmann fold flavoprotein